MIAGEKQQLVFDSVQRRADGTTYPANLHIQYSIVTDRALILFITDITEQKKLENEIIQARKLESIGQLAAGIAHEINTPAQFVSHNTHFLRETYAEVLNLLNVYNRLLQAVQARESTVAIEENITGLLEAADIGYLETEIPLAIDPSFEGIERISNIVQAMKEISHPGTSEMQDVDINVNIKNTITVASSGWKSSAEVVADLSDDLPDVPCNPLEISQVILNIIVNAAQAVEEKYKQNREMQGSKDIVKKRMIRITSKQVDNQVEIQVSDTGCGIQKHIQQRIFDPLFTTKEAAKGTGQGLSIAYATIVEKYKGQLLVRSREDEGTTSVIRLPLSDTVYLCLLF